MAQIERGGRFIEQQDRGLLRQHSRQRDPALLATREGGIGALGARHRLGAAQRRAPERPPCLGRRHPFVPSTAPRDTASRPDQRNSGCSASVSSRSAMPVRGPRPRNNWSP